MPIGELCLVAMRDVFTCKKNEKDFFLFFQQKTEACLKWTSLSKKSHRSAFVW